jgi:hypothetical protein
MSKADPRPAAVFVDKINATSLEGCSDFVYGLGPPSQRAISRLEAFDCRDRNPCLFSQLILGPCQQLTGSLHLTY